MSDPDLAFTKDLDPIDETLPVTIDSPRVVPVLLRERGGDPACWRRSAEPENQKYDCRAENWRT